VEDHPERARIRRKYKPLYSAGLWADADEDSGGNGFQHHRTGDALSRTTWMLAIGPGIRENVVYDRAMESVDLVPTIGAMLGFSPSLSQGKPITELS